MPDYLREQKRNKQGIKYNNHHVMALTHVPRRPCWFIYVMILSRWWWREKIELDDNLKTSNTTSGLNIMLNEHARNTEYHFRPKYNAQWTCTRNKIQIRPQKMLNDHVTNTKYKYGPKEKYSMNTQPTYIAQYICNKITQSHAFPAPMLIFDMYVYHHIMTDPPAHSCTTSFLVPWYQISQCFWSNNLRLTFWRKAKVTVLLY